MGVNRCFNLLLLSRSQRPLQPEYLNACVGAHTLGQSIDDCIGPHDPRE